MKFTMEQAYIDYVILVVMVVAVEIHRNCNTDSMHNMVVYLSLSLSLSHVKIISLRAFQSTTSCSSPPLHEYYFVSPLKDNLVL